jgi:hypothetical protein
VVVVVVVVEEEVVEDNAQFVMLVYFLIWIDQEWFQH